MFDFAVIGGGIIGTTLAYRIKNFPNSKIILIEKEKELVFHQTGHNSGVIHSGIYYPPGSLKTKLAVRGSFLMKEFCKNYGIPIKVFLILIRKYNQSNVLNIFWHYIVRFILLLFFTSMSLLQKFINTKFLFL